MLQSVLCIFLELDFITKLIVHEVKSIIPAVVKTLQIWNKKEDGMIYLLHVLYGCKNYRLRPYNVFGSFSRQVSASMHILAQGNICVQLKAALQFTK